MKKVLLSFFFLISFASQAQFAFIPDSAFRNFLISDGYAPAMVGDSLDTTSVLVTSAYSINCSGWGIQSLEGIQYFDSLTNLDCSVNYLDSLNQLPIKIKFLDCSKNNLGSFNSLPDSIIYLFCQYNQLTHLPAIPNNLISLKCSRNQLTSIPALPSALIELFCDSNLISSLPVLPTKLSRLKCDHNLLQSLPALPSELLTLHANNNALTSIPVLPDSILALNISYNQIINLPSTLPELLRYLYVDSTGISSLPKLPDSLISFSCTNNYSLDSLPILPTNLYSLYVANCSFSNIPTLPTKLDELGLDGNHLSSLPTLPPKLRVLFCQVCHLDSLPPLPDSLEVLYCTFNNLTFLPHLPSSLNILNCTFNLITELPNIPDSLQDLEISNNPISCMPPIKSLKRLWWEHTSISCLANSIQFPTNAEIYPAIDTLPLCQPSSGCPVNWSITGNIFHDLNNNCLKDSGEQNVKNVPVYLDSMNVHLQSCFTNEKGDYEFRAALGSYKVRINPTAVPIPFSCPASGVYNVTLNALDSLQDTLNFALSCPPAFDLMANSVTPATMFRPTRHVEVMINAGDIFGHFGTACFFDTGFVACSFTGPITYVGPAPGALTPTVTSPGNLRWNVNDFSLVDPETSFNIEVLVDSFASINTDVCFQLGIYPFIGDFRPWNNTYNACYPIRNSIDPNLKFMSPSGSVDTSDHVFNFTIFFQNTGNAPAEDIYIIDTLDSDLDVSTFEFLSSTHSVVTQILPDNIVRFNFHGINLVDSISNEALSHGEVHFKISRNANTGMGTEITNTAYIYFDQNAPIATNEVSAVVTSIVGINSIEKNKLIVYPNPAQNTLRLTTSCESKGRLELFNLWGEIISVIPVSAGENPVIDISSLASGVYGVSLIDASGKRTGRFVKR
jgi:uncharacterized repeat protein (TIGR01451 family)